MNAMIPGYGLQTKHKMSDRLDISGSTMYWKFQTCRHNKKSYIDDLIMTAW